MHGKAAKPGGRIVPVVAVRAAVAGLCRTNGPPACFPERAVSWSALVWVRANPVPRCRSISARRFGYWACASRQGWSGAAATGWSRRQRLLFAGHRTSITNMRYGLRQKLITATLLALLTLPLVQCGDDDDGCQPGVPCPCGQARGCVFHCPESGCIPTCSNVDFCDVSCGNDCAYTCDRVHDCSIGCGAGCDVHCSEVDSCEVFAGPNSSVSCRSLGRCRVVCDGPCQVDCEGVSSCDVSCSDGSGPSESGGRRVCN